MNNPALKKLQEKKKALIKKLAHVDLEYKAGRLEPREYFNRKFELLEGRFEDDVLKEIDEKIKHEKTKMVAIGAAVTALIALFILAPIGDFSGITGLLTFEGQNSSTLQLGETYTTDTVKNLSFLNVSSLAASGKIYGEGEAWIYLRTGDTRRLVYYADTRKDNSVTGMVVGGTLVNNSNITGTETTNSSTELNASNNTNTTNNETIIISNWTSSNTTNSSINTTVTTNETVINQTESVSNISKEIFEPEIILQKSRFSLGENITIQVDPENSSYRLYLFAPNEEYILHGDYWVANEPGNHSISGFITKDNMTERASAEFYVRSPLEVETGSFNDVCVETCSMSGQVPAVLEIVLKNTTVELDSITYIGSLQEEEKKSKPAVTTQKPSKPADPRDEMRKCLVKNPNQRPKNCFSTEDWEEKFPAKNFTLVNSLGTQMAVIDGNGNMHIQGSLIENSESEPQAYDFVVKRSDGSGAAWIDAITHDLHLKGSLIENEETLTWEARQDYVISNEKGMYLAIFKSERGDLLLRGRLEENR